MKNLKNVDWQIKKQTDTQAKLHFKKTNYRNKTFYQKSHLIAQRLLVSSIPRATAAMSSFFFSFWKLITSLVDNYWFQFGNKVKLKAFNAK